MRLFSIGEDSSTEQRHNRAGTRCWGDTGELLEVDIPNHKRGLPEVTGNVCPVCGDNDLGWPAYDERGIPSNEICTCCHYEFLFDANPALFREKWIAEGMPYRMPWFRPVDYNPVEQVKRAMHPLPQTMWEMADAYDAHVRRLKDVSSADCE